MGIILYIQFKYLKQYIKALNIISKMFKMLEYQGLGRYTQ